MFVCFVFVVCVCVIQGVCVHVCVYSCMCWMEWVYSSHETTMIQSWGLHHNDLSRHYLSKISLLNKKVELNFILYIPTEEILNLNTQSFGDGLLLYSNQNIQCTGREDNRDYEESFFPNRTLHPRVIPMSPLIKKRMQPLVI